MCYQLCNVLSRQDFIPRALVCHTAERSDTHVIESNSTAAAVGLGGILGSADGAEVFLTLGTPLQFGVDRWSTPFEI